ncbi:biopolymer transport protein, ExbB, partial [mine drainage metagenome]
MKMNGLSYLMRGGPIMYILLPMSGVALAVILERYLYLSKERQGTFEILGVLRKGASGRERDVRD